ncbi:LANO_0F10484g1_1 [Lachancea nothofagi CBS 11611]|uniref:LANO_0F10484g1_1 n=1 Tax=Lachancea nothofagi CBS 11611 TaxID=1266666 RepID=A0A1G4KAK8_9SACH|nr:LANO_0F10484g1_1 [Lachancea nothofagi CBS 11611]
MAAPGLVGEVQKLAIPDLRFQQTFQNALKREAKKNKKLGTESEGNDRISASVICKVVLRDVLLLPFLQGILWTGILIAMKPWLRLVVRQGQQCGQKLYNLVLGKNLVPKRE